MKDIAEKLDRLLKKRFFIAPTAQIYGGVSGLYDYGPLGVSLKNNLIALWREYFVEEENMLEVDASILTPYEVLKASGHVDKFSDILIFDLTTGDCYRADHFLNEQLDVILQRLQAPNLRIKHDQTTDTLVVSTKESQKPSSATKSPIHYTIQEIKDLIDSIESLSCDDINHVCSKFGFVSPAGNPVGNCKQFNLMFKTFIGPRTLNTAFLRPETAQSQFINFKKLLELSNEKLPFASASIGKVFRNEISPRNGLLRVREFEQAEIEYYVFPDQKSCKKFETVADISLKLLYSSEKNNKQVEFQITLKEAVEQNIINNETLAYFIGRTSIFLTEIGIRPEKLRFRQHKADEMAHYACDCWDAEILTAYGWIECVGIADRSCYDLKMHEKVSGADLKVRRKLSKPRECEIWNLTFNKADLGKKLRSKIKEFENCANQLSQQAIIEKLEASNIDVKNSQLGDKHAITIDFEQTSYSVSVVKEKTITHIEEITPNVIEPSFGIGRIFYSILEHSFWTRKDDEQRNVLSLRPRMAPYACVFASLRTSTEFDLIFSTLKAGLKKCGLKSKFCDRNISIGKKYSTYDEIGVPYFITIDPDSLLDQSVTIRDRDTMTQIRIAVENAPKIILGLVQHEISWDMMREMYPLGG